MPLLTPWQTAWQFVCPQSLAAGSADWLLVNQIADRAAALQTLADQQLRSQADDLRGQYRSDLKPEVTAKAAGLLREAVRRVLGIRLYPEQVLAGLAMARGAIAEMQTGEGKTLAAALPAFIHSLSGRGVHVITPNAYLARRDCRLLAPVYELLGASMGLMLDGMPGDQKRTAYACDITYGPGYEFGFDYLRDQLALFAHRKQPIGQAHRDLLHGTTRPGAATVQRGQAFAIIDEIDSVLIDEACTPLVISAQAGSDERDEAAHRRAIDVAVALQPGMDYLVDRAQRIVRLTDSGQRKAHEALPAGVTLQRPWTQYVEQALYVRNFLHRDVDYVVQAGEVLLVDEMTGRIFADRSWRGGLQQAVQAKERLRIRPEDATAARVSRQRYFQLYSQLCGMTGTAAGAEREFWNVYRLPVVAVPLRSLSRRTILPTRFFADWNSRTSAIVAEVQRVHATGRPVLIGTRTIENSQLLAEGLRAANFDFRLLNGKQDDDEAAIIAQAGQHGAITIATNMAGRGTDIKLAPGVAELGGLHLLAVECNDLERVDRQLVGRVGRQGDPGSCQFFISAEDLLVRRFAPHLAGQIARTATADDEETHDLTRQIAAVQRRVAAEGYTQRRKLLAYDRWLDQFDGGTPS